jgi:hypothetical protein
MSQTITKPLGRAGSGCDGLHPGLVTRTDRTDLMDHASLPLSQ